MERFGPIALIQDGFHVPSDAGGNHIGIDLAPDRNGVVGQVIIFGCDEKIKYVVANSWADSLIMLHSS